MNNDETTGTIDPFRFWKKAICGLVMLTALCINTITPQATAFSWEQLLFSPGFTKERNAIPRTYNTPYDCRSFEGAGWKGIAGGTVYNFDQRYQVSQAGCFKTERECSAYLTVMRGYIDVPRFMGCRPYQS